jgi:hypothetical protein
MRLFNIGGSNAGGTTAAGFTTEQINQITELLPYDLSMNETRCPITWTNFTEGQEVLQIRSCGHVFGPDALRTWFQQNRRCPICRINPIATNTTAGATANANTTAAAAATTNTTNTSAATTSLENVLDRWMNSITGTDGETTLQYEYTVDLTDLLSAALRGRGRN